MGGGGRHSHFFFTMNFIVIKNPYLKKNFFFAGEGGGERWREGGRG